MSHKILLYTEHGSVQLLGAKGKTLWSSDNDDEFAEAFEDQLDSENEDEQADILGYLVDEGLLKEGERVNIEESFLEDFDEDEDEDEDDEGDFGDDDEDDEDDEPTILPFQPVSKLPIIDAEVISIKRKRT